MTTPVIDKVIRQHAEELAFKWLLRDRAVGAPHYSLNELAKLDGVVEAHLDGLRIAGGQGWEACLEELDWDEPDEAFAATALAISTGDSERIDHVLHVAGQSEHLSRGVVSAFGWVEPEQARPLIEKLVASDDHASRRLGVSAAGINRHRITDASCEDHPMIRCRALRAAGELGSISQLRHCTSHLGSDDAECRFWAAWSGTLLGDAVSLQTLRDLAQGGSTQAQRASSLAARRLPLEDTRHWHEQLASNPVHIRLAVESAGSSGDPHHIPWLIELMANPELARPAGESFTMITGVDLAYDDLDTDKPDGFESGPTENPEDEDVAMDPDEDLPWPDPALLDRWWHAHRADFTPGTRYLIGKPITEDWMREVLRIGMQRQRAAAALELALMKPGEPLFEVRAPGFRQQRLLGLK